MKYACLFIVILLFGACEDTTTDDPLIVSEELQPNNEFIILEIDANTPLAFQNRETDFNFLLRAHFPPQTIEFDTESREDPEILRLQGNVKVWPDCRANGKIILGQGNNKLFYKILSGRVIYETATRGAEFDAILTSNKRGLRNSSFPVTISFSSEDGNDNPDCVIWDIRDSDGNSQFGDGTGSISYVGPCDAN